MTSVSHVAHYSQLSERRNNLRLASCSRITQDRAAHVEQFPKRSSGADQSYVGFRHDVVNPWRMAHEVNGWRNIFEHLMQFFRIGITAAGDNGNGESRDANLSESGEYPLRESIWIASSHRD